MGHLTKNWPIDPNFRNNFEVEAEFQRIINLGIVGVLNIHDNVRLTSNVLKAWSQNKFEKNPFADGSLRFDDFNYKYFNNIFFKSKNNKIGVDNFSDEEKKSVSDLNFPENKHKNQEEANKEDLKIYGLDIDVDSESEEAEENMSTHRMKSIIADQEKDPFSELMDLKYDLDDEYCKNLINIDGKNFNNSRSARLKLLTSEVSDASIAKFQKIKEIKISKIETEFRMVNCDVESDPEESFAHLNNSIIIKKSIESKSATILHQQDINKGSLKIIPKVNNLGIKWNNYIDECNKSGIQNEDSGTNNITLFHDSSVNERQPESNTSPQNLPPVWNDASAEAALLLSPLRRKRRRRRKGQPAKYDPK